MGADGIVDFSPMAEFAVKFIHLQGKGGDLIKLLIVQHLDALEDIYLAEKRLESVRAGRSRTIPLEQVMRRYGLED